MPKSDPNQLNADHRLRNCPEARIFKPRYGFSVNFELLSLNPQAVCAQGSACRVPARRTVVERRSLRRPRWGCCTFANCSGIIPTREVFLYHFASAKERSWESLQRAASSIISFSVRDTASAYGHAVYICQVGSAFLLPPNFVDCETVCAVTSICAGAPVRVSRCIRAGVHPLSVTLDHVLGQESMANEFDFVRAIRRVAW